jgi:hypothetical protein
MVIVRATKKLRQRIGPLTPDDGERSTTPWSAPLPSTAGTVSPPRLLDAAFRADTGKASPTPRQTPLRIGRPGVSASFRMLACR